MYFKRPGLGDGSVSNVESKHTCFFVFAGLVNFSASFEGQTSLEDGLERVEHFEGTEVHRAKKEPFFLSVVLKNIINHDTKHLLATLLL